MTCDHLSRLLALFLISCAARAACVARSARNFETKVSILLKEEPENPKCFAASRNDFTCFWEEDEERAGEVDQYSFTYTYQNENSSQCPLTMAAAAGGKRRFICHLDGTKMFIPMDIKVHRGGVMIHNRILFIELYLLLDPPTNVTVRNTSQQGQLNISWVPPPLKYMDDSMMYEVRYGVADGRANQVKEVRASSQLILRGLQTSTKYRVEIRVKLDGISYSGYWSAWSDPVFMETLPAELDPLVVSLTLIISFVLVLLSLAMLLSHQTFIMKKIWPAIPTPDSKFQGLFTVYGGDFEKWLDHTNEGLWLTSAFVYSEECPSRLEVLSELSACPALSPPLPPKASRASAGVREDARDARKGLSEGAKLERGDSGLSDGWRLTPHGPWLIDRLRGLQQHPIPRSHVSLLECHDAYITLSTNNRSEEERLDDTFVEALPLEVLFAGKQTALCESHSDLGSVQQSSGSGRLSSQSSFEYPHQPWVSKAPGYTYMAVADSGVSMDYSPMSKVDDVGKVVIYANEYKNEIPVPRRPLLTRQYPDHDDC